MGNNTPLKIFLTFDDGPHEPHTSQILDTLGQYGAKATFFVCGANAEQFPETLRRMMREGHAVGNHTYTHALWRSFFGTWGNEIEKTSRILESLCGVAPSLFRPPWGRTTPWLQKKIRSLRMAQVFWTIDSGDWHPTFSKNIARNILNKVQAGSVILLHNNERTARALPSLLEGLRERSILTAPLTPSLHF